MYSNIIRVFLFSFLILSSCKKESNDFPVIFTGEVTDITREGAVFHAKITDLSSVNILEYGFVWGTKNMPDLNSSRVLLAQTPEKGIISERITNDLAADSVYFVRAFARNAKFVTYGQQVIFKSEGSMAPSILDFYPKTGIGGTQVTITGENFSGGKDGNKVMFGRVVVIIDSASKNQLVVSLPPDLDISGMVKISVDAASQKSYSDSSFYLEGVTIGQIFPDSAIAGDLIQIKAENFNEEMAENAVYIDGKPAEIVSINNEIITVVVPYDVNIGPSEVALMSNQKTSYLNGTLKIKNPWGLITNPYQFQRQGSMAFSIGNTGYFGLGWDITFGIEREDFWEFNCNNNSWHQKSNIPGGARNYAFGFSIGNKGYAGLGELWDEIHNDLYEYDPENDVWTKKANFPGQPRHFGFCMVIGDKAYYGIGIGQGVQYPESLKDFWEFDPIKNTWTKMPDFPGIADEGISGFSIGIIGYIGLGWSEVSGITSNEFWKFDPVKREWTRMDDFPGLSRRLASSFTIGEFGYISMGQELGGNYGILNDTWRYNDTDNIWYRISDVQGTATRRAVNFVINNTAYLFAGEAENYAFDKSMMTFNPQGY